jgi:hypothetical protein
MYGIRRIGSVLEELLREVRSYFIPSHVRSYWELSRSPRPAEARSSERLVCFDFRSVCIDSENGRFLFALVKCFEALGFAPCFRARYRFLATMRHKGCKRLLLGESFFVYRQMKELPAGRIAAVVTDGTVPPVVGGIPLPWIRLSYDHRLPRTRCEIAMPYFVHPEMHQRQVAGPPPDLTAVRPWRVFFSGTVKRRKYSRPHFRARLQKLSRVEILESLQRDLPDTKCHRVTSLAELQNALFKAPTFIWVDGEHCSIAGHDWLPTLQRADFFLACPGSFIPLCHNQVESMAMGTVPILEHPEYFDPPLEDGINCLAFSGRKGLLEAMARAFVMAPQDIVRLRRGARAYYERHLTPGGIGQRLLDAAITNPGSSLLIFSCFAPRHRFG